MKLRMRQITNALLCFFYKVKYLNLHFADNKIYTLPSRAFPKLCVDGMYYTEEQIRHLREYAKARGVVLIPEFECPGHAKSLTCAYPEIFSNHVEGDNILKGYLALFIKTDKFLIHSKW